MAVIVPGANHVVDGEGIGWNRLCLVLMYLIDRIRINVWTNLFSNSDERSVCGERERERERDRDRDREGKKKKREDVSVVLF